jgi:hypothetical protein
MSAIDPDVLPDAARAVLDRLNVQPIAEYLAERLGITDAANWRIVLAGSGQRLRWTELNHVRIGNTELEYLRPRGAP